MDFPALPYFIDGKVKISQTTAIHQYIAEKWNEELLGKGHKDHGKIWMIQGIIENIKNAIEKPCYDSGNKGEVIQKVQDLLPPILKFQGKN